MSEKKGMMKESEYVFEQTASNSKAIAEMTDSNRRLMLAVKDLLYIVRELTAENPEYQDALEQHLLGLEPPDE